MLSKYDYTGKINFTQELRPWGKKQDGYLPKSQSIRIEILSANQPLSIHVHPLEMDQIFLFMENGSLYLDLKPDINISKFELEARSLRNISPFLVQINAKKGEMYYIPGGIIHSLIKGTVIEIILSEKVCSKCDICHSCSTYRIYDWKRDNRDLHFDNAFETIKKLRKLI